ncbi:helix-turn-helix domain-containing protein [Terribacillus sp. DMT04]|uniref:helix-turn-helix domain-containing protein n=1 Tax=Terribacillus sp. DMT04 TaxID=2850441 RepID=UPI001C2BA2DE|nr:helix-turn-helix transcriptional regulator [Terribacillus sp. DMT04]QXE02790.1 helix-turn-helix domain-containing protein [Terribacillus sp. DMT04]
MSKDIGKFIANNRKLSGFKTKREFANTTNISEATISRIERNIQKPNAETLKVFARYLKSTSLVELMVICDYWEEEDLLEPINFEEKIKETPVSYATNEKEFLNNLELSDKELMQQFNIQLDGEIITDDEAKNLITYLRFLRSQQK